VTYREAGPATTDPNELLEVYDAEGRPTGVARTRAAIHRGGDWHLAFFCWIVRSGEDDLEVVLQRRAATKDVWPGRFDASAAGHVRFGETIEQAAREIDEELGIHVEPSELQHVLRHRQEHVHQNGLVDREIHDVNLLRRDRPLDDYRPGPEVTALVSVPLDALMDLASGQRGSVATTLVTFDTDGQTHREAKMLHRDELVPYDANYYAAIAEAARAADARR
jgi:isopentenyldiphosphate isomerase